MDVRSVCLMSEAFWGWGGAGTAHSQATCVGLGPVSEPSGRAGVRGWECDVDVQTWQPPNDLTYPVPRAIGAGYVGNDQVPRLTNGPVITML